MMPACASPLPICPAPDARAPRHTDATHPSCDHLYLAPPTLQGVLVALVRRDTSGLTFSSEQRLSHFPASPLVGLSWYHGVDAGMVEQGADSPDGPDSADGPVWRSFGARIVLSGSQSQARVGWAPTTGRGYIACFTADVAHALFGIDLAAIQDRFVPAQAMLGESWSSMCAALLEAPDDAATLAVLECHLGQRWRTLQGRTSPLPSVRQLGRHWVERLAWQVHQWQSATSARQVERRVKAFSGRSLRQWQALTRTEGLFFAARDRYEAGLPFDWAALAHDEGFADQAHMSRAARQITGFPPGQFAQRFAEDESFWLYRLWV